MKMPNLRAVRGSAGTTERSRSWLVLTGRARLVGLVASVFVLLGVATQVAFAWATALPEDAVLRVGDDVITDEQFQQRITVLQALYGLKPPQEGSQFDRFQKDAAKSVAVSLIIDSAAQQSDVVIADKQARDALDKIVEEQLPGSRQDFVQFLGAEGIAEREVLDEIKRQLATSRLFERVTADVVPVTAEELRQAYQDRNREMFTPEKRHLRNIVVDSEHTVATVVQQAKRGADFGQLASRHSLDQSTRGKGGDLGTLAADQLDREFAKAAFAAPATEIFGPVKSQYGWNVGQVVEITPAKPLTFEQVKQQLEAELTSKRKLDAWRGWLAQEIKAADVDYADEYRPDDPEAPPTDSAPR